MPEIPHDAPLTEIWVTDMGQRFRVYRGDTQAHIAWKLHKYRNKKHEIIEIEPDAGKLAARA